MNAKQKKRTVGDLITKLAHDTILFAGSRVSDLNGETKGTVPRVFLGTVIDKIDGVVFDPSMGPGEKSLYGGRVELSDFAVALESSAKASGLVDQLLTDMLGKAASQLEGDGELVAVKSVKGMFICNERAVDIKDNPDLLFYVSIVGNRIDDPAKVKAKADADTQERAARKTPKKKAEHVKKKTVAKKKKTTRKKKSS